jgi:hypothetical protein
MPNGRSRLHGGKSTGPRIAEELESSRKAKWKHGRHDHAQTKSDTGKNRRGRYKADPNLEAPALLANLPSSNRHTAAEQS